LTQYGNFAPLMAECLRENLHYRGFAGTSAGQIAYAHHETAYGPVSDYALVIEPKPELDSPAVKPGEPEQQSAYQHILRLMPLFADYINKILLKIFKKFPRCHF